MMDEGNEREIQINPNLQRKKKQDLQDLFEKEYLNHERQEENEIQTEFKLNVRPHRKPFSYKNSSSNQLNDDELLEEIEFLLNTGVIRKSVSSYSSPVSVDGHSTVDFYHLNRFTNNSYNPSKSDHSIHDDDDLITKLTNYKYFSFLNLENSFDLVNIHEDSKQYTAFNLPFGKFEYNKMPSGLKHTHLMFQEYINLSVEGLINRFTTQKIIVHLNTILVATKKQKEHFEVLKNLFPILKDNKLIIQLNTSKFFYTEIEYLGYEISNNKITNLKHIETVTRFSIPENKEKRDNFLNFADYFKSLLPSRTSKLFTVLENPRSWFREKDRKAFVSLTKNLCKHPTVRIYNPKRKTELHCDASETGYGAVIIQQFEDWYPVSYFSGSFTQEEERKGRSFQHEVLAIGHALKHFNDYLGTIEFNIVTDCEPVAKAKAKSIKLMEPDIQEVFKKIRTFMCCVQHRSRNNMEHVDALSRIDVANI